MTPDFEKIANSTKCKALHLVWQVAGEDWQLAYNERLTAYDERIVDVLHCVAGCEHSMYGNHTANDNEVPTVFATVIKLFRNELSCHFDTDNMLAKSQVRQLFVYHFGIGRSLWMIAQLLDCAIIRYDQARQVLAQLMEPARIGLEIEDYLLHCTLLEDVDTSAVNAVIAEVLAANEQAVKEFKSGKEKALGSIIGQIMKRIKGDPKAINQQVRAAIAGML